MTGAAFDVAATRLDALDTLGRGGRVVGGVGLVLEATGPEAPVGAVCDVETRDGVRLPAEIVGFRDDHVLLMPLGTLAGVGRGARVRLRRERPVVRVGQRLLGRVVDALGCPLDGRPAPVLDAETPLAGRPLNPLERPPIDDPLDLGIRAVNALLTCGRGQRLGIFAGSGVGKSALLGQMARFTRAQVNVIALVGERGREVREFIERDLGDGLAHSVVIVATSEASPLVRIRGALYATAVAEWFRDQGADVLLMMDSLTRIAMAQREVGLSVGEPPSSRGYTPSVFGLLPRLLERAGRGPRGSVTGLYTVLVEGDDLNEPIADAARSLLDGHVVLSRRLASEGHFPAIDVLASLSRCMPEIVSPAHRAHAQRLRGWLATHRDAEDLIQIGAYARGSSPAIDEALVRLPRLTEFLRQPLGHRVTMGDAIRTLDEVVR